MAHPGNVPYQVPSVNPEALKAFHAADRDRSGAINADELSEALTNSDWTKFSPECCRLMIKVFDRDGSGTINIHEYEKLHESLNHWRAGFQYYDKDRSGHIEEHEVESVLESMGYRLSQNFVRGAMAHFDPKNKKQIKFDDFIYLCTFLRVLTNAFREKDSNSTGTVQVGYEDFLRMVFANL